MPLALQDTDLRMSLMVEVRNGRQQVVDFSRPLFKTRRRSPP